MGPLLWFECQSDSDNIDMWWGNTDLSIDLVSSFGRVSSVGLLFLGGFSGCQARPERLLHNVSDLRLYWSRREVASVMHSSFVTIKTAVYGNDFNTVYSITKENAGGRKSFDDLVDEMVSHPNISIRLLLLMESGHQCVKVEWNHQCVKAEQSRQPCWSYLQGVREWRLPWKWIRLAIILTLVV